MVVRVCAFKFEGRHLDGDRLGRPSLFYQECKVAIRSFASNVVYMGDRPGSAQIRG